MRISELSKVTGFSKSTIHHYVKMGLLPPPSRARSNLYLYDEAHVRGLERIERLKATEHLSLEQVKNALARDPLLTENRSSLPSTAFRKDREHSEAQATPNMHEIKKIQIIDKAIMLFSELGYEAVKISDITDALQMGKGTFYLYFKNKRELFLACFDRLNLLIAPLELREEIREEKDFFNRTRQRWVGFNENFNTFRGVLSLIRTACRSDEKDVKENAAKAYYAWIEPIRRDIEQAIIRGIIRPIDAELATFFALGMAESFSFRLSLDSRYSNEEVAELFYSILRRGLMADETGEDVQKTDQDCRVTVTDRNKAPIELTNMRFAGAAYLSGKLGESEIKVDLSKLSTISISSVDSKWFALLTAKSGQEISLEVDGSTVVTGDTLFGSLEISIERVLHMTISNCEHNM
jgi:AcrR family transcriptional regulator